MSTSKQFAQIESLKDVINKAQADILAAPEGSLLLSSCRGAIQYRHHLPNAKRPYLSKDDPAVKLLAQKDYATKVIKKAEEELARLKDINSVDLPDPHKRLVGPNADATLFFPDARKPLQRNRSADLPSIQAVFDNLSSQRRELVSPYVISDSAYAKQWSDQPFTSEIQKKSCQIRTVGGDLVRSKSEALIANYLFGQHIPYRYEQEILIGATGPYHPDFIVLNPATRQEFIWEHFGMMNDNGYCNKALKKLSLYAENGFILGRSLVCTFEASEKPLDMKTVENTLLGALLSE